MWASQRACKVPNAEVMDFTCLANRTMTEEEMACGAVCQASRSHESSIFSQKETRGGPVLARFFKIPYVVPSAGFVGQLVLRHS